MGEYLANNKEPSYKVVKEDAKLFHVLMVVISLSEYILHHMHVAFIHNDTARIYWYLK